MIKTMAEGWYSTQHAEAYTGVANRTIRRMLEDKPRDNIFLKNIGKSLYIRGCVLHGLKKRVPFEEIKEAYKSIANQGIVHINVSFSSQIGDISFYALDAVKKALNGKKCLATLTTGDLVEVTLQL